MSTATTSATALTPTVTPAPTPVKPPVFISFSAEINIKTVEGLLGVVFEQINKGASGIYLLMSTPGGQVSAGMNAYNVLKSLPVPLTTHNVGNVDSIGNAVFLAGTHRYACPHATFMFHGVAMQQSSPASLGEKELKEFLGSISADHTRIAGVIHDETAMPVEQVRTLFIEAQTKDADFAKANNIVSDIRGVAIPQGAPLLQLVFQR